MASNAPRPETRIAVFAKAPVPGAVKTRLAGVLGEAGAARLHERLVRHALATAYAARLDGIELWAAPDDRHPFLREAAGEHGAALRVQRGVDLGERMLAAFEEAHAAGARLVLVGTDCPALRPDHLQAAAMALDEAEAAIAPAEDGGYVLVAARRPIAALFSGIAWGTDGVMAGTRAALRAASIRWRELPTLWDVDRAEDYERLRASGLVDGLSA